MQEFSLEGFITAWVFVKNWEWFPPSFGDLQEAQGIMSLHKAHCHHRLCSVLHRGYAEKRGRGCTGTAVRFQLCGRSLGCLAGSSEEPCVLLLKVLPCNMCDTTCEAGVGSQASLFSRFGFSWVERGGRKALPAGGC